MPAGRERAGEEARALWRVHRLLGLSEVQVHPADHHGDQVPEVQRRGIRETRKHGEGWERQVPRILRLLAIPGLRFHDALYANRGAVPEVRSTVRGRKEDKNWDGQRVHKRRMRLGETGAGRGAGNGEGLGRSIWQADETGASRREVLRKRTLSPPTTESRYRTGSSSVRFE